MTNNIFIRFLLMPFAFLYFLVTSVRNKLFDIHAFKSFIPDKFTICVGNLAVGGTGKTPMVEYLVSNFSQQQTAVLSRGYGRKTKGFLAADITADASTIGDEPYQFWLKFGKKVAVFVGEKRVEAYLKIRKLLPDIDALILDDAFQHRQFKAQFNIVLVDYNNMIDKDWLMPVGKLREHATGLNRAQNIIVTKCPSDLTVNESKEIEIRISKYLSRNVPILFSKIEYGTPVQFNGHENEFKEPIVLASGIANSSQFDNYCNKKWKVMKSFNFSDHHIYSESDIIAMEKATQKSNPILVTEKDYVKLIGRFHNNLNLYYLPIKMVFLFGGTASFDDILQKSKSEFFANQI
jgi:tetraacyldisaccharide 4'-kinase